MQINYLCQEGDEKTKQFLHLRYDLQRDDVQYHSIYCTWNKENDSPQSFHHLKSFLRLRSKMAYRHAPIIIWFNGCWEEWIIY